MKKIFFLLAVASLLSFKLNEQKVYKVSLTETDWNQIFQVLDQSNAPHIQVEGVKKMLLEQLVPQLPKDSTKKPKS